jgi:hypothetical protein
MPREGRLGFPLLQPSYSMASEKEINQTLRSLHKEFDLLLDSNVISTELYDELTSKIPRRSSPSRTLSYWVQDGMRKPLLQPRLLQPRVLHHL